MHQTRLTVLDDDPAALDRLWDALAPEPGRRAPRIRAVMISSIDGTISVGGRSGGLGTPTDGLVYHAMRARADLVVVGSGTALAEGYGAAHVIDAWAGRRSGPPPLVLILTRTLPDALIALCADAGDGVRVAAAQDISPARVDAARRRGVTVHVLEAGPTCTAVRTLATELGATEVSLEGGPKVLGEFLAQGEVDELILSVAPEVIIGGDEARLASGSGPLRVPMRVAAAFTCPRGGLYTRWVIKEDG